MFFLSNGMAQVEIILILKVTQICYWRGKPFYRTPSRFLGPPWTNFNFHGDISPGSVCPYQEYQDPIFIKLFGRDWRVSLFNIEDEWGWVWAKTIKDEWGRNIRKRKQIRFFNVVFPFSNSCCINENKIQGLTCSGLH